MSNSSIRPIDSTLAGTITPVQSGPGSDGRERGTPHSQSLTIRLFSITYMPLVEFYSSAEMQSVYSTAPADWAIHTLQIVKMFLNNY